jgi:hypothetical protein
MTTLFDTIDFSPAAQMDTKFCNIPLPQPSGLSAGSKKRRREQTKAAIVESAEEKERDYSERKRKYARFAPSACEEGAAFAPRPMAQDAAAAVDRRKAPAASSRNEKLLMAFLLASHFLTIDQNGTLSDGALLGTCKVMWQNRWSFVNCIRITSRKDLCSSSMRHALRKELPSEKERQQQQVMQHFHQDYYLSLRLPHIHTLLVDYTMPQSVFYGKSVGAGMALRTIEEWMRNMTILLYNCRPRFCIEEIRVLRIGHNSLIPANSSMTYYYYFVPEYGGGGGNSLAALEAKDAADDTDDVAASQQARISVLFDDKAIARPSLLILARFSGLRHLVLNEELMAYHPDLWCHLPRSVRRVTFANGIGAGSIWYPQLTDDEHHGADAATLRAYADRIYPFVSREVGMDALDVHYRDEYEPRLLRPEECALEEVRIVNERVYSDRDLLRIVRALSVGPKPGGCMRLPRRMAHGIRNIVMDKCLVIGEAAKHIDPGSGALTHPQIVHARIRVKFENIRK